MKLIVAVDKNWAIGYKGGLLFRISEDLKNFKKETVGRTVILGRKTLSTFPGGRPLKDRRNIILTRDTEYSVEGAWVAHSIEEALELVKGICGDDVVVIGGGEIYNSFLPYVDTAIVTMVDVVAAEADTFLPNLQELGFVKVSESERYEADGIGYSFCRFERI